MRLKFSSDKELERIVALSKGEKVRVRGILDTFQPMIALDVVLEDVRFLD